MNDFIEDRVGCCCPDERFSVGIMIAEILDDRPFQRCNARESPATDSASRDFREKTFHLVEPTCTRRRKMQFEAGMRGEPAAHRRRLVGSIVIQD